MAHPLVVTAPHRLPLVAVKLRGQPLKAKNPAAMRPSGPMPTLAAVAAARAAAAAAEVAARGGVFPRVRLHNSTVEATLAPGQARLGQMMLRRQHGTNPCRRGSAKDLARCLRDKAYPNMTFVTFWSCTWCRPFEPGNRTFWVANRSTHYGRSQRVTPQSTLHTRAALHTDRRQRRRRHLLRFGA